MSSNKRTAARSLKKDAAAPKRGRQAASGGNSVGKKECRDGSRVIRAHLATLPKKPGVYRMLDAKGNVLYVGKAKSLKKRVSSYLNPGRLSNRIARMVMNTAELVVVTTHTEVEALLLESNLIKRFRPRYNVLLRDDKSFPYIHLTGDHDWVRLTKHRGSRKGAGSYFGPFASASSVNNTLNILQRAFMLRSCSDSVLENRSRPCLLHQIKRCTAPCVDRIGRAEYQALVHEAEEFLRGRSHRIQAKLSAGMQKASDALDYERAAVYRDRIKALTQIQARQDINVDTVNEADVIAAHQEAGQTCIQIFFFRAGQNWGNRAYFPRHEKDQGIAEVLTAFIGQFYENKIPPALVLCSEKPDGLSLLEQALAHKAERKVRINCPQRGAKQALIEHALANAREALGRRLSESASQRRLLDATAEVFDLDGPPERIEVYDNSHISGTNQVGAMIVAGPDGMLKSAYRKFNIKNKKLAPGDDYGMLREVLERRFARLIKENPGRSSGSNAGDWPDLVLIDGGLGQLNVARSVLEDLGADDVRVVGIAKGRDRNAGRERFFLAEREPFSLDARSPVLYYLQRLRDEAHRFAIGTHRAKRAKSMGQSLLDDVPGIGPRRKQALLHHFGAAKSVAAAGLADLETVNGISRTVAKVIYDHFHDEA